MILSSSEILKEIEKSNIEINPIDINLFGTVSYKFRLGPSITHIDNEGRAKTVSLLKHDSYILLPNNLYLAHTHEKFGSTVYCQKIYGIREIANFGLFIHVTANLGHTGSYLNWTLELVPTIPIKVLHLMIIGQITFWKTQGINSKYKGSYNGQKKEKLSLIHYKSIVKYEN